MSKFNPSDRISLGESLVGIFIAVVVLGGLGYIVLKAIGLL